MPRALAGGPRRGTCAPPRRISPSVPPPTASTFDSTSCSGSAITSVGRFCLSDLVGPTSRTRVRRRIPGGVPTAPPCRSSTRAASPSSRPSVATLYNEAQVYRRAPISPEGDRCEWFASRRSTHCRRTWCATIDPACGRLGPDRSALRTGRCPARLYLLQRMLVAHRREATDPLEIEETALSCLHRRIRAAYASRATAAGDRALGSIGRIRAHLRAGVATASALAVLATSPSEPLTLADAARVACMSACHLSRVFVGADRADSSRPTGTTFASVAAPRAHHGRPRGRPDQRRRSAPGSPAIPTSRTASGSALASRPRPFGVRISKSFSAGSAHPRKPIRPTSRKPPAYAAVPPP